MSRSDFHDGKQTEEWFDRFARATGLLYQPSYSLKQVVEMLASELPIRLEVARPYLYEDFPDGNEWIDTVLLRGTEPAIAESKKIEFANHLMDVVAATDRFVNVPDAQGQMRIIAVDVTSKQSELDQKLQRIQGLPEAIDTPGMNRNRNLGKVRKAFGIDKHLALILNRDPKKLPSYEKLFVEIKSFAQQPQRTAAIDLHDVPKHELFLAQPRYLSDPKRLFNVYMKPFVSSDLKEQLSGLARVAIRDGHPHERVRDIVLHHEFFKGTDIPSRLEKAQRMAQNVVKGEYANYLESHQDAVINTCSSCLRLAGTEIDGRVAFDGIRYFFEKEGSKLSISAKDGRGVIFASKEGEVNSRMLPEDIAAVMNLQKQVESAEKTSPRTINKAPSPEIER